MVPECHRSSPQAHAQNNNNNNNNNTKTKTTQHNDENSSSNLKVGVVEVVGNVETQGAKFASLQQNTMVEAQGEQQAAVLYFLGTAVEFLLRNEIVEPQQVVLQTLGRLCCDLDGSLVEGK